MIIKSEVQKTIIKEVSLKGVGLHTGEEVVLNFKPASANTGFVFVRTDLSPNVFIPADAQYVINTDICPKCKEGELIKAIYVPENSVNFVVKGN